MKRLRDVQRGRSPRRDERGQQAGDHERYVAGSEVTGLQNEENVEVRMGLLNGESVVSSGFETLRDQSRVRILR